MKINIHMKKDQMFMDLIIHSLHPEVLVKYLFLEVMIPYADRLLMKEMNTHTID